MTALAIAWAIVIGLLLPSGPAAQKMPERSHLLAAPQLPQRPHKLVHHHHTFDNQDAWEDAVERTAAAAGQPQQATRHISTRSLHAPTGHQRNVDQPHSRKRRVHTPPPRKQAVAEKGVLMTLREQTQSDCDLHLQTALKYA